MFRNDGGTFTDVAPAAGVAGDYHATTSTWGDFDNDGRTDLYVAAYLANIQNYRDYLYRNLGDGTFIDVLPGVIFRNDATHGVQWADFDQDGDLDLALADNGATGKHFLFRNDLASPGSHSVAVLVLDEHGRYSRAGSEVRAFAAGSRRLLAMGMVDTGSGYCSQNAMPVYLGLGAAGVVDIEVTTLRGGRRHVTRVPNVNVSSLAGKPLVVKAVPAARPLG